MARNKQVLAAWWADDSEDSLRVVSGYLRSSFQLMLDPCSCTFPLDLGAPFHGVRRWELILKIDPDGIGPVGEG